MQMQFGLLDGDRPARPIQRGDDDRNDLGDANSHVTRAELDRLVDWDDQQAGLRWHFVQLQLGTWFGLVECPAGEQLNNQWVAQVEFFESLQPEPIARVQPDLVTEPMTHHRDEVIFSSGQPVPGAQSRGPP
jgi:hypothetical protein